MIITHITSVHPRYDTRIYLKECAGLARGGHTVHLVVADGGGDEVKEGVAILEGGAKAKSYNQSSLCLRRKPS